MVEQLATLYRQAGILFFNQPVDATCRVGRSLVKFIDIGADGDEAESLRRLAVLAGGIGDGGSGGQFPEAGEENDEPPCSVSAFQPSHCGEKFR